MAALPERLRDLIEAELAAVSDSRVLLHIRTLLVTPRRRMRQWDYSATPTQYECWDVLVESGGPGIAFSDYGFGPKTPWGLVRVSGSRAEMSMGMDCGWYPKFMDAYFESAASEIDIWRVFRQAEGEQYPGTPISGELSWDSSWSKVMAVRKKQGDARINHCHSIDY
ncbi:MAG: hypothetical protein AB8G17_08405 [Gammaproteobacteria bacterium]